MVRLISMICTLIGSHRWCEGEEIYLMTTEALSLRREFIDDSEMRTI